jgi:hypothetical protein
VPKFLSLEIKEMRITNRQRYVNINTLKTSTHPNQTESFISYIAVNSSLSTRTANRLMLFMKIVGIDCPNNMKHINIPRQNAQFRSATAPCTCIVTTGL